MAIKERKQITGTTEQINAYEGHEGQIVWDKDKKTLVGMSGTAGTNYPLAQQAYVDTKFLPLTGGNVTGELRFGNIANIQNVISPEYEYVAFQSYDYANNRQGSFLVCRGHSGSVESERGSFVLGAVNKDGTTTSLTGDTAGKLLWAGNEVLRVAGSGIGWVRFNPNLQICFGSGMSTSEGSLTVSYGAPFSSVVSIITAVTCTGFSSNDYTALVQPYNNQGFNVFIHCNGAPAPMVGFTWCAFGYY